MDSSSHWGQSAVYQQIRNGKSKAKKHDYSSGIIKDSGIDDRRNIEVITAKEVAELLKISVWMVYELVKREEIPHFKVGRSVRFVKSEVVGWMVS